jgi:ATP-dependent helicase/nuclease subunit A
MAEIGDREARTRAATTFDRNVVVTASAGTGKTTLLVDRLVHLIVKEPDPVPLPAVVAMTFMEKAASEIKIRLRERLLELIARPDSAADLLERYGCSAVGLKARAETAVQEVERSQIGTIHSFAAHLLRLYPVEAGVDPGFETDEGLGFAEHFSGEWERWLDGELGAGGARHEVWKRVLRQADLLALRELAQALASDLVPLPDLVAQTSDAAFVPVLRTWLQEKKRRATELVAAHQNSGRELRQVEKLLHAAEAVFGAMIERGARAARDVDDETIRLLDGKEVGSKPPSGWDKPDFDDAVRIVETARMLIRTDHDYLRDALTVLAPFAEEFRRKLLDAGLVTFDGLLVHARDLLKRHRSVREKLKRQFKAILVDEFQDTDPVQYEILFFLAERPDGFAAGWREAQLDPGKLFIVGDPKQSIFAFRRADIQAFQDVTGAVIAQGGLPLTLTTNFRSHATILAVVNGVFERLIFQRPGLQPPYDPLAPQPDRRTGSSAQGVDFRLVASSDEGEDGEELSAECGIRAEAEALARWLTTEVIGKAILTERDGSSRAVEPGHVALLFRTFSQSWDYLEALRRHGLAYVAEGEKHFYRRQEVVDFVNLLRAINNPYDTVALVGVLRTALGALTDREIVELAELEMLDYRQGRHPALERHAKGGHLRRLFTVLETLQQDCPRRPLPDAVGIVFERLPILELAAASLHGEQALANLWKIRALAGDLVSNPGMTLAGFVDLLAARIADPPEEPESGLAEESLEAVRVLSIHKSKGLEFPIVVLVGVHGGTQQQYAPIQVHHDWSTGVVGLRMGPLSTLGGVYIAEKLQDRTAAERRRLLYVGMTRARERLVLSGALTRRPASGNFLGLLREGVGGEGVGRPDVPVLAAKEGQIAQAILPADEGRPRGSARKQSAPKPAFDLSSFQAGWQARVDRHAVRCAGSAALTPTTSIKPSPPDRAMVVGSLFHKVMENWSYNENTQVLLETCQGLIERWLPDEWQHDREEILEEIRAMLGVLVRSEAYAELSGTVILGREVPFLGAVTQEGGTHTSIMEGRIDLIYEKDGGVWIADFKTDRVLDTEIAGRVDAYRCQAAIYTEAVRRAIGRRPRGFNLIFVRSGQTVPVAM